MSTARLIGSVRTPLGLVVIYVGTIVFSNLIAVALSIPISRFVFTPPEQAVLDRMFAEAGLLINLTPFPFVVAITTPVLVTLYHGARRYHRNEQPTEGFFRELVNGPIKLSMFAVSGWLLGFFLGWGVRLLHQLDNGPVIIGKSLAFTAILGIITFVSNYYLLEAVNRRCFHPYYFQDKSLLATQGIIHLTIRTRFLIFLLAVSLLPMVLFGSALAAAYQFDMPISLRHLLVLLSGLSASAILLTLLFARSFQSPLEEMTQAAQSIEKDQYDIHIQVRSGDELGILGDNLNRMAQGLIERDFIKDSFGRVVDPHVRDYLIAHKNALVGDMVEATVLFMDIRDFTSLSENTPPPTLVLSLNRFFDLMTRCIERHSGIINKFIGDAILAIFGAPVPNEDHAHHALLAAVDMLEATAAYNAECTRTGCMPIRIGIGIHSGKLLAGNIGSARRLEYTVIGDVVNTAARLESHSKTVQADIVFSDAVKERLPASFPYSVCPLGEAQLKGKDQRVGIHTLGRFQPRKLT